MVPPRYIILEVGDQLIRCLKNVSRFLSVEVPVIAFPDFVVVTQNAFPSHDIRQSVFEAVW
jgi:hypothetical protein